MTDTGFYNLKNCANQNKSMISPDESIFLYTIFQYYLEKAVEMMNSEDKFKREKALTLLNSLLENSFLQHFKSNRIISACIRGLLNFYIGLLKFNDEEQAACESPFLKALDNFNTFRSRARPGVHRRVQRGRRRRRGDSGWPRRWRGRRRAWQAPPRPRSAWRDRPRRG